ncbi:aldo/keto reductase [Paracoccus kondratievae]|nr:aldo/keto reductase [Paracoccus kondratievae]
MGYGAMQLQRLVNDRSAAMEVLHRAVGLGVEHFDTAEFYGAGFVNDIIRELRLEHPNILIATKVGAASNPAGPIPIRPAQKPEELRASVEENLRSLGVEQLDVVNLRRLDVAPGLSSEGDQIVGIDDQLAEMLRMKDEGKIGGIGLSAVSLDNLKQALPAGIVCVQNAYSLLSRRYQPLLELCEAEHIAWVPFFPLGGTYFPDWPKVTAHPKVIQIAARYRISPSQLGLAWLLHHKRNVLLIPGTTSLAHLEENVASASIILQQEDIVELDALSCAHEEASHE